MKNREELLLSIIHFMAEKLKAKAVLEGGMLLRLLGCPRSTQDVDYVLLSAESKKKLAAQLKKMFLQFREVRVVAVNLNSRGIFLDVESGDNPSLRANVEISVVPTLNLPLESVSTAAVARPYSLGGRIVSTVAMAEAFSNKIAAALERDSVRDLYDLSQIEPLCAFDATTLTKRLSALSVERGKPKPISFEEAAATLKEKGFRITEKILERELYPLLPPEERQGLVRMIQAAVSRIAAKIEQTGTP